MAVAPVQVPLRMRTHELDHHQADGRETQVSDPDLHVTVKFGKGIPVQAHGEALLAFEKHLRALSGVRVEVFGIGRGDDSKLRAAMTVEQRAKL